MHSLHPRRTAAAVLSALVLAASATAAVAAVEEGRSRKLAVALEGGLTPSTLPRHGTAPVALRLTSKIIAAGALGPPALKTVRIALNPHGRIDYRGLPVCRLSQLEAATTQGAMAACREAVVGYGRFHYEVALPAQPPFPTKGGIVAFNGRHRGRHVVFAHVYGAENAIAGSVIVFRVTRGRDRGGVVLTARLPAPTVDWARVSKLSLTLRRTFMDGGVRRSYLTAGCPAPEGFRGASFVLARASFGFVGGRTLASSLLSRCRARG
jgi:hypothetical protein